MDGIESDKFFTFKSLVASGIQEVHKNLDELESLIMILAKGNQKLKSNIF